MSTRSTIHQITELCRRVHRDERGAVTLETVLIVAAIAMPILVFILKFGWPKIRYMFEEGVHGVEEHSRQVIDGN